VCINLHRAPGYCINGNPNPALPKNQNLDLFKDIAAQAAFTGHRTMFAERYKGVANEFLSFNPITIL
jgi:hypothetical protein